MNALDTSFFTTQLLKWYQPSDRPLPWKGIKNPYFIWLSEIILQQTRVEQGLPYYEKFIRHYPKIEDLAAAKDDEVMKHWEGLGYYSRARNMLAAARYVTDNLGGQFPSDYKGILALKGVGPYTAAAIASFAFNLPHAVLDGNVFRVLSRFFGIDIPVDSTQGKKYFQEIAQACLDNSKAATYNQAIMDFGATLCKPQNPKCESCPFKTKCQALATNRMNSLPVKTKKIKKRTRHFYFLEVHAGSEVLLQQRTAKDIWQSLYQFPLLEMEAPVQGVNSLFEQKIWSSIIGKQGYEIVQVSKPYQQQLTHQKIVASFLKIKLENRVNSLPEGYFWHPEKDLKQFAFPKVIDWYLGDNSLYLNLSLF